MSCKTNSDFSFYRGDHYNLKCIVKQSGTPVNITGGQLIFSVKENPTDANYIFQRKNAAAGGSSAEIEDSNPTVGEFIIHIIPTNTNQIPGDYNYWFDIQISLGGVVTTLKRGRVLIAQDITI